MRMKPGDKVVLTKEMQKQFPNTAHKAVILRVRPLEGMCVVRRNGIKSQETWAISAWRVCDAK